MTKPAASSAGASTASTAGTRRTIAATGSGRGRGMLRRVPVWAWRALMRMMSQGESARFNAEPIVDVDYHNDIDFVGDGIRAHRLDVITPRRTDSAEGTNSLDGTDRAALPLPVYVYFHGGGWTSGDKGALTKYCASQAVGGMVVVNVNYRMATRFTMTHMLQDANAALAWVAETIGVFGGDPERIVLGGDSAGGQIAALLAATSFQPELARHYGLRPATAKRALRGVVQHCSVVDFSVLFERGFILSLNFVRMLLPRQVAQPAAQPSAPSTTTNSTAKKPAAKKPAAQPSAVRHHLLRRAAHFLSPIEWLDGGFPPVFVTTSERDYFYRANLNFVAKLRTHAIPVETLIYSRSSTNTLHTWQQNYRYPESQEVYRRLQAFVRRVAAVPTLVA